MNGAMTSVLLRIFYSDVVRLAGPNHDLWLQHHIEFCHEAGSIIYCLKRFLMVYLKKRKSL